VAFQVQSYGLEMNPSADAYAQRMLALPALGEWYEAAIAETFREAAHEAEAIAAGTCTQDLRATAV
jgi:glutathione S-transferase